MAYDAFAAALSVYDPPEAATGHGRKECNRETPRNSCNTHGGRERFDLLATTLRTAACSRLAPAVIVAEMDDAPHAQELVQSLGARYVFIRAGGGLNKARSINVGTALARSEFVLWLDSDLLLPDEFLDFAVAELRDRELDCLIPWTSVRYLDGDDSRAVMAGARRAHECRAYYTRRGVCGGCGSPARSTRRCLRRSQRDPVAQAQAWGAQQHPFRRHRGRSRVGGDRQRRSDRWPSQPQWAQNRPRQPAKRELLQCFPVASQPLSLESKTGVAD
jgi:hypothetical protein